MLNSSVYHTRQRRARTCNYHAYNKRQVTIRYEIGQLGELLFTRGLKLQALFRCPKFPPWLWDCLSCLVQLISQNLPRRIDRRPLV